MNRSALSCLAIAVASTGLVTLALPSRSQPSPSEPASQQSPPPTPAEPAPQSTPAPATHSQPASTQSAPAQPKVINSVHYKCDDGKGFKAVFRSNKTVQTTFGSKVLTLPQVESGSGFRYSDGSVTLVGKGNEASVEVGDRVLFNNCVGGGSVQGLW